MPSPTSLVVTNGSKSRSRTAGGDAGPVVLHLDAHALARRAARAHRHAALLRSRPDAMAAPALMHQVEQHLRQPRRRQRHARRARHVRLDARRCGRASAACTSATTSSTHAPHVRRRRAARCAALPGPRGARSRAGRAARCGCARSPCACAAGSPRCVLGGQVAVEQQVLHAHEGRDGVADSRAPRPPRGDPRSPCARCAPAAPAPVVRRSSSR